MRNTLKKLFLIDMLYAFIASSLAVMVPLYLIDIKMDVVSIGLILSIIPLSFMFLRLLFASIADSVGTKTVEILESIAAIAAILIYILSNSARGFALAQFGEAVRDAGFWATARTDIVAANGKDHLDRAFAYLIGIRQLADGFGRISIGFFIFYFSFQTSFYLMFGLSVVMLGLVLTINKNPFHGFPIAKILVKKIFHKRSKTFWVDSFGIAMQQLVPSVLMAFLLPLYVYTVLDFGYSGTAAVLAIFSLVTAAANLLAVKYNFSKSTLLFSVLMSVPALVLIPYLQELIIVPVVVIGISSGCGNLLSERLVCKDVSRKKNISTEVGAIYFPYMVLASLFIGFGGLAIENWGYLSMFYLCAFIMLYYVIYVRALFKRRKD